MGAVGTELYRCRRQRRSQDKVGGQASHDLYFVFSQANLDYVTITIESEHQ